MKIIRNASVWLLLLSVLVGAAVPAYAEDSKQGTVIGEGAATTPSSGTAVTEKPQVSTEPTETETQNSSGQVTESSDNSWEEPSNSGSNTSSSKTKPSSSTGKNTTNSSSATPATPAENASNISYVRTYTTQQFIELIGEDARKIGTENGLYASVMIAQAILESASGSSSLARDPNFNLFGIKGSYNGQSVSMSTQEDSGGGNMYTIVSAFRKYNSYAESMQDYANLLKSNSLYQGAWKANTKSYQDATAHLTGRYATDTVYNVKLNKLIETYNLDQYDVEKKAVTEVTYVVGESDTLPSIAKQFSTSVEAIVADNDLGNTFLSVGQELKVSLGKTHKVVYADEVEKKKGLKVHVVSADDSLQSIAEKYSSTVVKIIQSNELSSNFLKTGQRLYIPQ